MLDLGGVWERGLDVEECDRHGAEKVRNTEIKVWSIRSADEGYGC